MGPCITLHELCYNKLQAENLTIVKHSYIVRVSTVKLMCGG